MLTPLAAPRHTDRLVLRPWSRDYLSRFAALCADPGAMPFITGGRPIAFEDVEEISNRSSAMWDEHGYGPWGAFERESERSIGRIGLNLLHDWPGQHKWEVGFEIVPEFWGQGFATEGAREAIRFGFEDVRLDRIISVTVHTAHHDA